jgi:hypothetical protein
MPIMSATARWRCRGNAYFFEAVRGLATLYDCVAGDDEPAVQCSPSGKWYCGTADDTGLQTTRPRKRGLGDPRRVGSRGRGPRVRP